MDKKMKYRAVHHRCRLCEYYKRKCICGHCFPWCDLKERYLKDRLFTESIQGCFCKGYDPRKEG